MKHRKNAHKWREVSHDVFCCNQLNLFTHMITQHGQSRRYCPARFVTFMNYLAAIYPVTMALTRQNKKERKNNPSCIGTSFLFGNQIQFFRIVTPHDKNVAHKWLEVSFDFILLQPIRLFCSHGLSLVDIAKRALATLIKSLTAIDHVTMALTNKTRKRDQPTLPVSVFFLFCSKSELSRSRMCGIHENMLRSSGSQSRLLIFVATNST